MKKITLILAMALVGVLLVASSAMALKSPYTHGDFASNSKGCGDCHVTHSAGAAKLLNTTSSYQTTFCIGCHGRTSPFDVQYGQIVKDSGDLGGPIATRWDWSAATNTATGTYTTFSLAGGFQNSLNFDLIGGDAAAASTSGSVHNVKGLVDAGINIAGVSTYGWVTGDTIPGGTSSLEFECGSCHDPHAGGAYDNDSTTKNARLLKENILGRSGMRVKMAFATNGDNTVTSYTYGFNTWCGACHDLFDTSIGGTGLGGWRSGADKTTYARTKYMHKFGIAINPASYATGSSPYVVKYLPLETGNVVSCITCHRAHASSAPVSGLTWNRYTTYKTGGGASSASGSGSALLRMPDRDVCWACHGAATLNHSVTHTP